MGFLWNPFIHMKLKGLYSFPRSTPPIPQKILAKNFFREKISTGNLDKKIFLEKKLRRKKIVKKIMKKIF